MRGSVTGQLNNIYRDSGIDKIGHSKHEADAKIREQLKAEGNLNPSKHEIAQQRAIHGTKTRDNYLQVWKELLNDQKAEYGKLDADKITPQDVERFLAENPGWQPRDCRLILADNKIDLDTGVYLRLNTAAHGSDGFFAAVLERS